MFVDHFNIEQGNLYAYYKEGNTMAKVDLGNVVGPQGDTGPQGIQGVKGDTGPRGPQGTPGISPTFTIENGHLFADYDNPYSPT